MKAFLSISRSLVIASAALFSTYTSAAEIGSLTVFDQTAQDFIAIFKVAPDANGIQSFKTTDGSLEVVCSADAQSCSFSGEVNNSAIVLYHRPAEEFANVLGITPDSAGDRKFLTSDGQLEIWCVQGESYSCSVRID
ncbi:MAG: hypothetical protein AB7T49_13415 [Oligoflexales bacterium]